MDQVTGWTGATNGCRRRSPTRGEPAPPVRRRCPLGRSREPKPPRDLTDWTRPRLRPCNPPSSEASLATWLQHTPGKSRVAPGRRHALRHAIHSRAARPAGSIRVISHHAVSHHAPRYQPASRRHAARPTSQPPIPLAPPPSPPPVAAVTPAAPPSPPLVTPPRAHLEYSGSHPR